jgi:hypothetical protein
MFLLLAAAGDELDLVAVSNSIIWPIIIWEPRGTPLSLWLDIPEFPRAHPSHMDNGAARPRKEMKLL